MRAESESVFFHALLRFTHQIGVLHFYKHGFAGRGAGPKAPNDDGSVERVEAGCSAGQMRRASTHARTVKHTHTEHTHTHTL